MHGCWLNPKVAEVTLRLEETALSSLTTLWLVSIMLRGIATTLISGNPAAQTTMCGYSLMSIMYGVLTGILIELHSKSVLVSVSGPLPRSVRPTRTICSNATDCCSIEVHIYGSLPLCRVIHYGSAVISITSYNQGPNANSKG